MSLLLLLRDRGAATPDLIDLGFYERTKTVYALTFTQEQTVIPGFIQRSKTVYPLTFSQEQSISLGFYQRTRTVFSILFNNGDIVILDHSSLPDLIYARLHPLYGNGLSSLNNWMEANGYTMDELSTVFGQTASEAIEDAAYRYFREEFVG